MSSRRAHTIPRYGMAATASRYAARQLDHAGEDRPLTQAITRGAAISASRPASSTVATHRPSSSRRDETRAERTKRTPVDSTCRAKAVARAPVPAADVAEPIAGRSPRTRPLPDAGNEPGHGDVGGVGAELRLQHRPPDGLVAGSSEPARGVAGHRRRVHPATIAPQHLGGRRRPEPDAGGQRQRRERQQVPGSVERMDLPLVQDRHRGVPPLEQLLHAEVRRVPRASRRPAGRHGGSRARWARRRR